MAKRKPGRPKAIRGELTTCTFELTKRESAFLTRRAKGCGVSRSAIVRTLVDLAMAVDVAPAVPTVIEPGA